MGIFPPLGTGPDFVLISAGTDPLGRYVITRDFYMMTTPVTEGMWDSVILNSSTQSNFPKELTWYEAIEFANELSNLANLEQCYADTDPNDGYNPDDLDPVFANPSDCTGYRLPTQAEWYFASRAGTTGAFWTENGGGNINFHNPSPPNQVNDTSVRIIDVLDPPFSDFAWWHGNSFTQTWLRYQTRRFRLPNGNVFMKCMGMFMNMLAIGTIIMFGIS